MTLPEWQAANKHTTLPFSVPRITWDVDSVSLHLDDKTNNTSDP